MMLIAKAATIATGVLAFSSIRNVAETIYLINKGVSNVPAAAAAAATSITTLDKSNAILQQYIDPSNSEMQVPSSKNTEDIIEDLRQMKRQELLKLFMLCEAPKETEILQGSWDGILLNNNQILTTVSGFITNELFGRRFGKWRGKRFGLNENREEIGINLFESKTETEKIESEHMFNYFLSTSKFGGGECIILEYKEYQGALSPWNSMIDEARVLRISSEGEGKKEKSILLCMGSIAWSSHLNGQPFCLVKQQLQK